MAGTYVWTGLSAKTIANYFLELGRHDGIPIDPLKLQKLVYLAHGWSLAFLKRPLIKEPFEAWRYGPVVQTLYREFQSFGASPITSFANKEPSESSYGIDSDSRAILDEVWERYKSLSPFQFSMLTHEPGSAWDLTMRSHAPWTPWTSWVIPNDLIAQEFLRRQQQG